MSGVRREQTKEYEDENYSSTPFLISLRKMYNENPSFLSDVTIIANGKKIPAHRIILALSYPFMEGYLRMHPTNEISLPRFKDDFGYETLERIIGYAYTGKITISTENAMEILYAGDYLQSEQLVRFCEDFIIDHMEEENVYDIWQCGNQLSLESQRLKSTCVDFVALNYNIWASEPSSRDRLFAAPLSMFEYILKSRYLVFRNPSTGLPSLADEREKSVIREIHRYVNHQTGREGLGLTLLRNVNWLYLTGVQDRESLYEGFNEQEVGQIEKMLGVAARGLQMFKRHISADQAAEVANLHSEMDGIKEWDEESKSLIADGITWTKLFSFSCDQMGFRSTCLRRGGGDEEEEGEEEDEELLITATSEEVISSLMLKTGMAGELQRLNKIAVQFSSGRVEEVGGELATLNEHQILLDRDRNEFIVDFRYDRTIAVEQNLTENIAVGSLEDNIGETELRLEQEDRRGNFLGELPEGTYRENFLRIRGESSATYDSFLVGFKVNVGEIEGQRRLIHLYPIWRSFFGIQGVTLLLFRETIPEIE